MRVVFRNMFTRPWPQRIGRETFRAFPILSSGRVTVFDPLLISASLNQSFVIPCSPVYEKLEAEVSILVSRPDTFHQAAIPSKDGKEERSTKDLHQHAGRWSAVTIRTEVESSRPAVPRYVSFQTPLTCDYSRRGLRFEN